MLGDLEKLVNREKCVWGDDEPTLATKRCFGNPEIYCLLVEFLRTAYRDRR